MIRVSSLIKVNPHANHRMASSMVKSNRLTPYSIEKAFFLERPTRCYQPRDAGYHDTNLRYYSRWYYNPDQDTCHLFVYRGLGGNENNFPTLHQCHSECISK